ncbi:MAG TPA: DUF3224 domain-containing protein [Gemmatimonadaceae bacterium]|nr:DUF3224 domain-containing protein [Gemmatimonadaceae bacterium]
MSTIAAGPFEVSLKPLTPYDQAPGSRIARMSLDKRYRGDLEATSVGEMLSAGTAVSGSAAYVAIERVTGTLDGRDGSFALSHIASMTRGAPDLRISVVPDSGTDGLAGISGTMQIDISGGKHSYRFEYRLADHS